MGNYRDSMVWQRSYQLVLRVYQVTAAFPAGERFGLTDQLRRAAASIAINVAEGAGRFSDAEQRRFLRIARGSANEVTTELLLASDLGYLPKPAGDALLDEIGQIGAMITSWIHRLDAKLACTPTQH